MYKASPVSRESTRHLDAAGQSTAPKQAQRGRPRLRQEKLSTAMLSDLTAGLVQEQLKKCWILTV